MTGDSDPVESARRGDRAAVDALLVQHLPGLRAYLRLRMGPALRARENSLDLAQSVCREILDHLDRYQRRGDDEFRAWLYTEAARKLAHRRDHVFADRRDLRREAKPGPAQDDESLSAVYCTVATPSRHAAAREHVERLEAAFDQLREDSKQVILLSRLAGLPHARVAEELGKSEGAVRVLLHRALLRLADLLEERGTSGPGTGG